MNRDDAVQAIAEALVTIPGTTVQYPRSVALTILDALAPFLAAEREAADRLGGMVEWLAEVIIDAREACQRVESITPMGSPEWVESGIAMRTTVLYEIRKVLDRERNADPSRYDAMRERAEKAEAALAAERESPDVSSLVTPNSDDYHTDDCAHQDRPGFAGPFPCDCDGPALIAELLARRVERERLAAAVEAMSYPDTLEGRFIVDWQEGFDYAQAAAERIIRGGGE